MPTQMRPHDPLTTVIAGSMGVQAVRLVPYPEDLPQLDLTALVRGDGWLHNWQSAAVHL